MDRLGFTRIINQRVHNLFTI